MQPVLVNFKQSNFNLQKEGLAILLNDFKSIVKAFNSFGYEPLKSNELQRLFNDIKGLVFDKVTKGQNISIGEIEIEKEKAIEFIKKPEGLNELINQVSTFIQSFSFCVNNYNLRGVSSFSIASIDEIFNIDSNNDVFLSTQLLEKFEYSNKQHVEQPIALKLFELAKMIKEKCSDEDLKQLIKYESDGIGKIVKHIFHDHTYGSTDIYINIDHILKYNQPSFKS